MYQNKNYWRITLSILIIFFLGLAGTSIGHIITYWHISNDWIYPEILAAENAVGIISSILLTFHKSKKLRNLGIMIFLATFFVELAGNVYYYYITIKPESESFNALVSLTQPIFDANGLTLNYGANLRSWTAFVQGFWLPLTHVCVFGAIAILIEKKYEQDHEDENAENTKKDDDGSENTELKEENETNDDNERKKVNDKENIIENVNDEIDDSELESTSEEALSDVTEDEGLQDYLKDDEDQKQKKVEKRNENKKKDAFLAKTWRVKK